MTMVTALLALKLYVVVYSMGTVQGVSGPYASCPARLPALGWRYEVRCERHRVMPNMGWVDA